MWKAAQRSEAQMEMSKTPVFPQPGQTRQLNLVLFSLMGIPKVEWAVWPQSYSMTLRAVVPVIKTISL